MKNINSKILFSALLGTICIVPLSVWAINTVATGFKTTATNVEIDAHNVCKTVKHIGSNSYFVPTKTSTEWLAFNNNNPSDTKIVSCGNFTRISSGLSGACAIRTDDRVVCWGGNQYGELGNNSTTNSGTPVFVSGGHKFLSVDMSNTINLGTHVCAIRDDSKLMCWGYNASGQVGDATTTNRSTPRLIASQYDFLQVSTRMYLGTCALRSDNKVMCWGLGIGNSPQLAASGRAFKEISGNCGLESDGDVYCASGGSWVLKPGGNKFKSISAWANVGCGIKQSDNKVMCWNGDGSTIYPSYNSPTLLSNHTFRSVSQSHSHACGVRLDNKVMCWGNNTQGQLGRGSMSSSYLTPALVSGGYDFYEVTAGGVRAFNSVLSANSCGLLTNGTVRCWGGVNNAGYLGDGTNRDFGDPGATNYTTPHLVVGGHTF